MVSAIIVAAGSSTRMGTTDKLFLHIGTKPVILHTLLQYQKAKSIDEIVVVTKREKQEEIAALCRDHSITKVVAIVEGGSDRNASVRCGIAAVSENCTHIAIADGARPLTDPDDIDKVSAAAEKEGAAILGVPVKDTIKQLSPDGKISITPPRDILLQAQTPQTFCKETYIKLSDQAMAQSLSVTDDSSIFEAFGHKVTPIIGSYKNIKITTPEDILIAEKLMEEMV